jgi:hypothetical protein
MRSAENTLWLLDDSQGNFSGALIELEAAVESNAQWQLILNGILENFVKVETAFPTVEGLYSISFSSAQQGNLPGMLISKISGDTFEESMSVLDLPENIVGMLYITHNEKYSKIATLSLIAGFYYDSSTAPKPNRVLGAVIKNDELVIVRKHNVPPSTLETIKKYGKSMIAQLDSLMFLSGKG